MALLHFSSTLFAQSAERYTTDTLAFLSLQDSSLLIYTYPQLQNLPDAVYESRINEQIKTMLLPDASVFEKLQKISVEKFTALQKRSSVQEMHMRITWLNSLIVCLQTRIKVNTPGMPGEAGDLYYNTISIASGNEYYLNNLFMPAVYDTIFSKNKEVLQRNTEGDYVLKEHIVSFGLTAENGCADCLTLEVIVNNLYGPEGPRAVEIRKEDLLPLINPDGPLKELLKH